MKKITVADVLALPVSERILLVEDVWDSIIHTPEAVHLTDAQREELDRRLESSMAIPRRVLRGKTSWAESAALNESLYYQWPSDNRIGGFSLPQRSITLAKPHCRTDG